MMVNLLEEEIRCIQSSINRRQRLLTENNCISEDKIVEIKNEIQLLETELKKRLKEIQE